MKRTQSALILSIAAALTFSVLPAHARDRQPGAQPHRHDFQHKGERHTRRGQVVSSETTQQATATGFKRNTILTNAQGQTATRQVEVSNDPAAGTHTRTMSGTTFDGKPVSGQSVTTRTDDGYTRQGSFTGPNGQTSTRDVDVSRDGNTVTKTVTTTNPQGQTQTHAASHQIQGKQP